MKKLLTNMGWRRATLIATLLSILLTATGLWQLVFVAGIIAGLLVGGVKKAFSVGFSGVIISWIMILLYLAGSGPVAKMMTFFASLLGLSSDMLWVTPILSLLVGGVTGGLGGGVAASLVEIAGSRKDTRQASKPEI